VRAASPDCRLSETEKEKKAKEHIDFITTLEDGYEHIAGNGGIKRESTGDEIPNVSWWVKIEDGIIYIADTKIAPDGLSYMRPKNEEWMVATKDQIQLLKQLPLMKII
jgi:hypothetical protein